MNVPSAAIVIDPPCVVANVPVVNVTAGESLAVILVEWKVNGVDGLAVVPPVITSCVLLTRLLYVSPPRFGLIAIVNDCVPKQLY